MRNTLSPPHAFLLPLAVDFAQLLVVAILYFCNSLCNQRLHLRGQVGVLVRHQVPYGLSMLHRLRAEVPLEG